METDQITHAHAATSTSASRDDGDELCGRRDSVLPSKEEVEALKEAVRARNRGFIQDRSRTLPLPTRSLRKFVHKTEEILGAFKHFGRLAQERRAREAESSISTSTLEEARPKEAELGALTADTRVPKSPLEDEIQVSSNIRIDSVARLGPGIFPNTVHLPSATNDYHYVQVDPVHSGHDVDEDGGDDFPAEQWAFEMAGPRSMLFFPTAMEDDEYDEAIESLKQSRPSDGNPLIVPPRHVKAAILTAGGICIGEGTPVALPNGSSISIEELEFESEGNSNRVLGYNEHDGGIVNREFTRFTYSGEQECVELTFYDGRKLVCTPDHKVLTDNGDVEAQNLSLMPTDGPAPNPNEFSYVVCTVDAPLISFQPADFILTLTYCSAKLSMDTATSFKQTLAFMRILGYFSSTRATLHSDGCISVSLDHELDLDAIHSDLRLILGDQAKDCCGYLHSTSESHCKTIPSTLSRDICSVSGMEFDNILQEDHPLRIPVFLLEPSCPLLVVQEFLGGLFGGSGHAPVPNGAGFCNIRLVALQKSAYSQNKAQFPGFKKDLCTLLNRCGITIISNTTNEESETIDILQISTKEIPLFNSSIGFRYCLLKQTRLSVAAAYYRRQETISTQRNLILENVANFWYCDESCERNNFWESPLRNILYRRMVRDVLAELDEQFVILDVRRSVPDIEQLKTRIYQPNSSPKVPEVDTNIESATSFVESIGANRIFADELAGAEKCSSASNNALATFRLPVIARKHIGKRKVYDISVPKLNHFVANGVVVHNCPGLNNVIRSLVLTLHYRYQVTDVIGLMNGFEGLNAELSQSIPLTPATVKDIHNIGGTILKTSRGPQSIEVMVSFLEEKKINMLFCIGGDGTAAAASKIASLCLKKNLPISVVGIPKTIDNDIVYTDTTFGFNTAVELAQPALRAAHCEARSVEFGVGIVKLMGRDSGFIALHSSLSNSDVNLLLIPEVKFTLKALKEWLTPRLLTARHCVIVISEGAASDILPPIGKDKSGNVKFADVGSWLKTEIEKMYADKNNGISVVCKLIDPSYIIRAAPANAADSLLCCGLAQAAVHAAMAGKTNLIVSQLHSYYVHVPLERIAGQKKRVQVLGYAYQSFLDSSGQPFPMGVDLIPPSDSTKMSLASG